MSEYRTRVDALDQSWREWARIGAELTEDDWHRPTRCEGWQVVHLYAHHSAFPMVFAQAPDAAPDQTVVSAVDVLRGFNEPGGVAHTKAQVVAEHAVTKSVELGVAELVDRFAGVAPVAIDRLRAADPTRPMWWATSVIPLAEALRIAVLEATVHLLDLVRALDREPTVPDIALRETALLLAEMAPAIEFIDSATGRASAAPPLPVIR